MKTKWYKIIAGMIGGILLVVSIFELVSSYHGLEIISSDHFTPPTTIIAPKSLDKDRPLILAGHGFAGSRQNLYGFALTFAHAGYPVVLWDFDGHGSNPDPFPNDSADTVFQTNVVKALDFATKNGFQAENIAIMGHSMGSGVALNYGVENPHTMATIAVSPVMHDVSPQLPKNLLLMAGENESPFIHNAEQILQQAGGEGWDHKDGTARRFVIIPYVEHVSILFSPVSHRTALAWLNATFSHQEGAEPYTDYRIAWWGLAILGVLLIAFAVSSEKYLGSLGLAKHSPLWRQLLTLIGGASGATIVLWLLDLLGVGLQSSLGLLVGGYLLIWFAVAGLVGWLFIGFKPSLPNWRAVVGGLVAFSILWLGIGLLTHYVWMSWLLIPRRLILWPLGTALLLPWFLMAGTIVQSRRLISRLAWWAGYSVVIVGGLYLAISINPEIGFLMLILPMIPFILALHAIVAWTQRSAWAFAISGAGWISWAFIAFFPLQ